MKLNGVLDMKLVEKLIQNRILSKEEFVELLSNTSTEDREILRKEAVRLREKYYGHDVYIRGLMSLQIIVRIIVIIAALDGIIIIWSGTG